MKYSERSAESWLGDSESMLRDSLHPMINSSKTKMWVAEPEQVALFNLSFSIISALS
jgi:hypothetical protein